jgi:hypothetical protein
MNFVGNAGTGSHYRLTSKLCSVLAFVALSGCGENNPYKERDKKCKVNCGSEDAVPKNEKLPRNTNSLSLGVAFWDQNVPRTQLTSEQELGLATLSPFAVAEYSLASVQNDIVRTTSPEKNPYADARACVSKIFQQPKKMWLRGVEYTSDYGKCVPLAALDAADRAERQELRAQGKAAAAALEHVEFERAFRIASPNTSGWNSDTQGMALTETVLEQKEGFPFVPLVPADVQCSETRCADIPLVTAYANVNREWIHELNAQGQKTGKKQLRRVAQWYGLGESEDSTLNIHFEPQSVVLNGSVYMASSVVQDPKSENPYQGKLARGQSVEFEFRDFKLLSNTPQTNVALGFGPNVLLEGLYVVYVNQPFDKSAPANATTGAKYVVAGKGQPCLANLYRWKSDNSLEPVKIINLCEGK